MTQLTKLSFKTVERAGVSKDPTQARRNKITAAIDEQQLVLAARLKGQDHTVEQKTFTKNEQGERIPQTRQRKIRPWFFAQDSGVYVQCRYGARVLLVDGENNAVFVKSLQDVGSVLDAFKGAAKIGELDAAIAKATERKAKAV